MSRSPVVARRRLGTALRDLRAAAGLKIENAAQALECSSSKVSRLENGKGVPRLRDVRDLVTLYGAQEQYETLAELVSESLGSGGSLVTDFKDVFEGDMISDDIARFVALEQDSSAISSFQPELIPGLLQTEAYATAVARLFHPDHPDDRIERFVKFRLGRQKIIERAGSGVRLSLVLGEQALHRLVGGTEVMRAQLRSLAAALSNGRSHVEFQVAPLNLVSPGALGGPFTILQFADPTDQDVVYLEGRAGAVYLETDEQVDNYKKTFIDLANDSYSRSDSIKLVEDAARSLS